jgi:hypothetical protein
MPKIVKTINNLQNPVEVSEKALRPFKALLG